MGDIIVDETQNTTAGWVTIASTKFFTTFSKLLIHVFELVGAQSIQYRVQASNDADFDGVETLADINDDVAWAVAASGIDFQTLSDCWNYVRVQVINGSGIGRARCIITGSADAGPGSLDKNPAIKDTYVGLASTDLKVDDTTTYGDEIDIETRRKFLLQYSITETGVVVDGDRLRITVQFRVAGGTWCDYYNGPFGALFEEESTIPINACVSGDCIGEKMRVCVTTDYTNATPANNYFTIVMNVTVMR